MSLAPLVLGLSLFLGGHGFSRAQGARAALIRRLGENTYRALYSLFAIFALALIVIGYADYRASGYIPIWQPPRGMAHLAIPLMGISLVLLASTYLPGFIKSRAKHPMLAAVKVWAFSHLLVNGDLGSMLLFGAFLGWAVFARIALKRAGAPTLPPMPWGRNDWIALAVGTGLTLAMIFGLHNWLIGVGVLG